jgi:hypothetical protein
MIQVHLPRRYSRVETEEIMIISMSGILKFQCEDDIIKRSLGCDVTLTRFHYLFTVACNGYL